MRPGIAAAVTTVAGLSMSKQASAANGGNFILGAAANTATLTTGLSGGSTLRVIDGSTAGITGGVNPRVGSIYGLQTVSSRAGVMGEATGTSGGWGVYGRNSGTGGIGIYGLNVGSGGVGVYGEHRAASTESGTGVVGVSNSGAGVSGTSSSGVGVVGSGTSFDLQASGSGRVLLSANGVANPPAGGSTVGTIAKDSAGNHWVCVASGTPGTWRKLAGPSTSGSLHLITPKRVYDSRPTEAPVLIAPKTPLSGATRTIDCTLNTSGVPANAAGLLLNVTAVTISASGFLAVTPGGAGFTGTSTLNWASAGIAIANSVTVAAGAGAKLDLTTGGGGNADVIVDVFGFYL